MKEAAAAHSDVRRLIGGAQAAECAEEWKQKLGLAGAKVWLAEPESEEEVSAILQYASRQGLAVIPAGGGNQLHIGEKPRKADLVVSSRRLTGIVEHSVGDLTMTVKAGTPFAEIQSYLKEHGQHIPICPATSDDSTVGGLVATAACGPERVMYGSWRDNVIGLRVVYPDGKVIRTGGKVVKNVAGYDMNKLFVGSYGTLAFITEVTLRVRPYPKHREAVLARSRSLDDLTELASRVLASECIPAALELVNGGEDGVYELAVGCDEAESAARYQAGRVRQLAAGIGRAIECAELAGGEVDAYWQAHRTAWKRTAPDALVLRGGWPIPVMADQLALCGREAAARGVAFRFTASLGTGTLYMRLESGNAAALEETASALRKAAEHRSGYLVVESGEAELKRRIGVWGDRHGGLSIMKGIKQTVDPGQTMSPGRFAGGI